MTRWQTRKARHRNSRARDMSQQRARELDGGAEAGARQARRWKRGREMKGEETQEKSKMQKMQKMQQQLAVQPAASGVLRARGPPLSSSAGRAWREAVPGRRAEERVGMGDRAACRPGGRTSSGGVAEVRAARC
jgi:hypothetical protein